LIYTMVPVLSSHYIHFNLQSLHAVLVSNEKELPNTKLPHTLIGS
jgi:hypothetical protein